MQPFCFKANTGLPANFSSKHLVKLHSATILEACYIVFNTVGIISRGVFVPNPTHSVMEDTLTSFVSNPPELFGGRYTSSKSPLRACLTLPHIAGGHNTQRPSYHEQFPCIIDVSLFREVRFYQLTVFLYRSLYNYIYNI